MGGISFQDRLSSSPARRRAWSRLFAGDPRRGGAVIANDLGGSVTGKATE
jgi:hypothetical protein